MWEPPALLDLLLVQLAHKLEVLPVLTSSVLPFPRTTGVKFWRALNMAHIGLHTMSLGLYLSMYSYAIRLGSSLVKSHSVKDIHGLGRSLGRTSAPQRSPWVVCKARPRPRSRAGAAGSRKGPWATSADSPSGEFSLGLLFSPCTSLVSCSSRFFLPALLL